MTLFDKPYSEWQKEDLEALVAEPQACETNQLEFKADCAILSDDRDAKEKARFDILKDIAAMANGAGGAILVGVRQSGDPTGPAFAARIEGIREPERLIKTTNDLVRKHLQVCPASLESWSIRYTNDTYVVVIDVPKNVHSLSMVTLNDRNQFWVRIGTSNRLMTTDEIQYKLLRLSAAQATAEEELDSIRNANLMSLSCAWVWFAGVPLDRSTDHIPVRVQDIKKLLRDSRYFAEVEAGNSFTPAQCADVLAPSLRGLNISRHYSTEQDRRFLEIRRDGTLIFANKIGPAGIEAMKQEVEGSVPSVSLPGIYATLMSGLYALADIQGHYHTGRAAIVQAGIKNGDKRSIKVSNGFLYDVRLPSNDNIQLKAMIVDEHWQPRDRFMEWARQLANAMELEDPIPQPPWVPDSTSKD